MHKVNHVWPLQLEQKIYLQDVGMRDIQWWWKLEIISFFIKKIVKSYMEGKQMPQMIMTVKYILIVGSFQLEMERVFTSASANNPQKFYIRIGIRICGCCRWNLRIYILIRTLSAIHILIRIRTMQRRMRGLLSI